MGEILICLVERQTTFGVRGIPRNREWNSFYRQDTYLYKCTGEGCGDKYATESCEREVFGVTGEEEQYGGAEIV